MNEDRADWIDTPRCACLCDVGGGDYLAAVAIGADGQERLILALRESLGDENVTYDPACSDATHERVGPLPLEYVRRITICSRTQRCGRRTKTGAPCQIPVSEPGDACGWHRQSTNPTESAEQ
jgi:hypothetical protein